MKDYAIIAKQEKLITALRREVNYLKSVSSPTDIENAKLQDNNDLLVLSNETLRLGIEVQSEDTKLTEERNEFLEARIEQLLEEKIELEKEKEDIQSHRDRKMPITLALILLSGMCIGFLIGLIV